MAESVDVLFVDEAGQLSLANVVAVAPAARNLVLVGDPQQQLSAPLKGTHPDGAGASAVEHVLGDHATRAPRNPGCSSTARGACIRPSARSSPNRL